MTALLVIIYISFISLGLPDAVMGASWPTIHQSLNVPVSYAGFFTMIVSGGTIISSFFSEKLIRRFGTGKITAFSVLTTAIALLGITYVPSFVWICLLGIPLGVGAGAVDSALNNFVAVNFKAKHMSWLHCFWGVGAMLGPIVMSIFLAKKDGWRDGYKVIAIFQFVLVAVLFATLKLWKMKKRDDDEQSAVLKPIKFKDMLSIKGAKPVFLSFFAYCSLESTAGFWGSSYLVLAKGLSEERAAQWMSVFYLGITLGRFVSGIAVSRIENKMMIKIGQVLIVSGLIVMLLPLPVIFQFVGIMILGVGCAPIYPAIIHETPSRFGIEISQAIMGVQMAIAYVGTTFVPPLFGMVAKETSFAIFPIFLILLIGTMIGTDFFIKKAFKGEPKA